MGSDLIPRLREWLRGSLAHQLLFAVVVVVVFVICFALLYGAGGSTHGAAH